MDRPSYDEYFINITIETSKRSTCERKKIGCILVDNDTKHILSTGYNGSLPGELHCCDIDVGCLTVNSPNKGSDNTGVSCIRTIHAEKNAVAHLITQKRYNITAYCTYMPCYDCLTLLLSIGVNKIIYINPYKDKNRDIFLKAMIKKPEIIKYEYTVKKKIDDRIE